MNQYWSFVNNLQKLREIKVFISTLCGIFTNFFFQVRLPDESSFSQASDSKDEDGNANPESGLKKINISRKFVKLMSKCLP